MSKTTSRCAECCKRIGTVFISDEGLDICKTCYHAGIASSYLRRMETRRKKDEPHNKRAYEQCRELAAWLSVYRFGVGHYQKRAAAYLDGWAKYK